MFWGIHNGWIFGTDLGDADAGLSLPLRGTGRGWGLFLLFVDLSFWVGLGPVPGMHLPLPPLREESKTSCDGHSCFVVSIFLFVDVFAMAP